MQTRPTSTLPAFLLVAVAPLCWAGNIVVAKGVTTMIPPVALAFWRWTAGLFDSPDFRLAHGEKRLECRPCRVESHGTACAVRHHRLQHPALHGHAHHHGHQRRPDSDHHAGGHHFDLHGLFRGTGFLASGRGGGALPCWALRLWCLKAVGRP